MKPLSLKMRAIGLLSQREHSLLEMRRKLLRIAREQRAGREQEPGGEVHDVAEEVEQLLTFLQAQGYLSEARFVESRVHARAQRYGSLRIRQELAQHGLTLGADEQAQLKASELERALVVWQRKFGGQYPVDAAARAKQTRFLLARGFEPELISRLLRAATQ